MARFRVQCVGRRDGEASGEVSVIFHAADVDDVDNIEFFERSPSGQINLQSVSGKPAEEFEVGEMYVIEIKRVKAKKEAKAKKEKR